MLRIENDTEIKYEYYIKQYPDIDFFNTILFDIETTGFSAKNTKLYMIGLLYADNTTETFHSVQWFLDEYNDEVTLIKSFINFASGYTNIMHYNGQGFDIPYLEAKCIKYNIEFDFNMFNHIDLYKCASRLKNFFKTENLKQKTMENFFDLNRKDIFSGGELISVYHEFMERKDERALNVLLLHNYEDLKGMLTLINILSYNNIFNGKYILKSINIEAYDVNDEIKRKEAIIECELKASIPTRISYGKKEFYMTAFDNILRIRVQVYTDELKFFYPNYKDYYYLPEEDMSIHKSVAFYVDKNFRTRAKAANCYSKKTGQFLPQYEEIIKPYFKKEYHDKFTYFEATDEFMNCTDAICQYVTHILNFLRA